MASKEKGAINMCTVKCKEKKVIVFHIRVWGALCEYISGMYILIFVPEIEKKERWSSPYLNVTEGAVVKYI